jgi:YVTN family beta-propeller protein
MFLTRIVRISGILLLAVNIMLAQDWLAVFGDVSSGNIVALDTQTDLVQSAILASSFQPASFMAITPDAKSAFVALAVGSKILIVDTAGNPIGLGPTISVQNVPVGTAITPNGQTAYVCNLVNGTISVIDVPSQTVTQTISTGLLPGIYGIAITPDATKAYVTNRNNNLVNIIDLPANTVRSSTITVGTAPSQIAVTPNGAFVYVANLGSNNMTIISTQLDSVVGAFSTGTNSGLVAISADGTKVCSIGISDFIIYNILEHNLIHIPITLPSFFGGFALAITPDSKKAYFCYSHLSDLVGVVDLSSHVISSIPLGGYVGQYDSLAITPDQAPTARFTSSVVGNLVTFDASTSSTPTGEIGSYAWDFGDGKLRTIDKPVISHIYKHFSHPYKVTLVVTNSAGTSEKITFTGQTVSNNGGPSARVTHHVGPTIIARPRRFKAAPFVHDNGRKLYLHTRWKKSPTASVARYKIFAYHKHIATVKAKNDFKKVIQLHPHSLHTKHLSKKYRNYLHNKYRIRAITHDNEKSDVNKIDVIQ